MHEPPEFVAPRFRSLWRRVRFFLRYRIWTIRPEHCAVCLSCGGWIYPGEPIADGPVHRTFDCCSIGLGGWGIHDLRRMEGRDDG